MRKFLFCFIFIAACGKPRVDPTEHNPGKLTEAELKNRLAGTWLRVSQEGFNQITLSLDGAASYTTHTNSGSQVFEGLRYKIQKDKNTAKVVFFKNGLEKATEQISSISATSWQNNEKAHRYEKK